MPIHVDVADVPEYLVPVSCIHPDLQQQRVALELYGNGSGDDGTG
ncbi:MAG: hypothetical protein OXH51_00800 [Gemmatimonadetes bacterium]|nr:hypothetical protein [Gemmatimonadota bacterium]